MDDQHILKDNPTKDWTAKDGPLKDSILKEREPLTPAEKTPFY